MRPLSASPEPIAEPRRARLYLHSRPTCWPMPAQEPLICAAAGDPVEAVTAWERCASDPELDSGLLPQVFRNLTRHGYPHAGQLQPNYDAATHKNQVQLRQISPILRGLHLAGIPTLLLNGVALTLATYRDPGARPIRGFHVLVPTLEADRALEHLAQNGWRSLEGLRMGLTPVQRRYRHAMQLISPTGQTMWLFWHLLAQSRTDEADAGYWQEAWPAYVDEDRSLVLAPTHQLLHTCAQSLNGDPQWAVDALVIIRQSKIKWEQLLGLARWHDIVLTLADALGYLLHAFHANIPRSLVWRLESEPIGRLAQLEYRRLAQPEGQHGWLVDGAHRYRAYLRGARDLPQLQRLAGFAHYLADQHQLAGVSSLPRHWLRTGFGRGR